MAATRKDNESSGTRRPPATTPEGRENQLISLAFDLAEKKLREGTASAQETVHFLKLGSQREKMERQKLAYETELLKARKETIESGARMEELYSKAIDAMKMYGGQDMRDVDSD